MSQRAVRASKREIRKAFGADAVDTLAAHDTLIEGLAGEVKLLHAFRKVDTGAVATLTLSMQTGFHVQDAEHRERVKALAHLRNDIFGRTLFERLRWLFFGK